MLLDHHHPVTYLDCLNASIHFLKNLQTIRVDPSLVVISGESECWRLDCGHITQVLVSQAMLPQFRAQFQITPVLQGTNFQLPSHQQIQNVPLLTRDLMITFLCIYLNIDLS